MTLLYLSYWGLDEGLTHATVFPHLSILLKSEKVDQLIFVTIERNSKNKVQYEILEHHKIIYEPLITKNLPVNLINKIADFIFFPSQLKNIIQKYNVDKVIARGAPAGALIHKVCREKKIPYFVESFEPHAQYMLESGVWKSWDPRFVFEKRWEQAIKKEAAGLMPVAENYKIKLVEEGVKEQKIMTVPCNVDIERFGFDPIQRSRIRKELKIPETAETGIYVGKFGGIYYDKEAFLLFKKLLQVNPKLYFVILTPDSHSFILEQLKSFELSIEQFKLKTVSHTEVPFYLSAADFGLATIKPAESRKYWSAIKVGEYWANGLSILITPGVGDDSAIIEKLGIGAVLSKEWQSLPKSYFDGLLKLLQNKDREKIREVAKKYRSIERGVEAYQFFQLI